MELSKNRASFTFQIVLGSILVLSILWFYRSTLLILANALTTSEDYSFGLLLPLVSCYIVYLKWPKISQSAWQPSWLGLLIIFLGFGLYIFGELVAVLYLGPISFLVVLTGLLFLLWGWDLVRLLWFPLFLLFFMVPLPAMVIKNLTLPLQLISSWLAAGLLHLIGIPLLRQGNVIDLGVRQLQVVDACSGLRYILSLFSLGMIYCYFYQRCLWKAAVLLICLVPAAILANALRVAAMGLFPALQEGFLHSFSGWLIFVFCLGLVALLNWIMNYLKPPAASGKDQGAAPSVATPAGSSPSKSPYLIAALILIIICGPLTLRLSHARPVPLLQTFDNFPMQLGPWQGHREYLDAAMAKAVGADQYLEAVYANPGHASISVWIAYFETQQKGLDQRLHSPIHCLTGAGGQILESHIIDLSPGHPVRYLLMKYGDSRQIVYFWYLQRGRWLSSEYDRYFFMGLDGLVRHRNDGAIVRLITPIGSDLETSRQELTSFAKLLLPVLHQFISD
jgi:exosortase D (VPLPA-CTERM-specific)